MMSYELNMERRVFRGDSAGANIVHNMGCRFDIENTKAVAKYAKEPTLTLDANKGALMANIAKEGTLASKCKWEHWNVGVTRIWKILTHVLVCHFIEEGKWRQDKANRFHSACTTFKTFSCIPSRRYLQQKCENILSLKQRQVLSQAFYTNSKSMHSFLPHAITISTNGDALTVNSLQIGLDVSTF